MSSGDHTDITCACGEAFKAWIWQSANVGRRPGLREEILRGTMNVVTCPACGARFHVEVPFLYHDPEGREWIWVYPARYEAEAARVAEEVEAMWDRIAGAMPPELRQAIETTYKTRLLFGMDALVAHLRGPAGARGCEAAKPPPPEPGRKPATDLST